MDRRYHRSSSRPLTHSSSTSDGLLSNFTPGKDSSAMSSISSRTTPPHTPPLSPLIRPISEPVTSPRTEEARRQLYLYHDQVITTLEGKDRAYAQAHARATQSGDASEAAQRDLSLVEETEARLATEVNHLSRNRLRRAFFRAKVVDDVARLQQQLSTVSNEVIVARQRAQKLTRRAKADAARALQLRGDAELLETSVRARRDLLNAMCMTAYGGDKLRAQGSEHASNASDEKTNGSSFGTRTGLRKKVRAQSNLDMVCEDAKRKEWTKATNHAHETLSAQDEAYRLLTKARAVLKEVRRHLWDAFIGNTRGGVGGSGSLHGSGGLHGHAYGKATFHRRVNPRYEFKRAAWQTREAGKRIERAVAICDELPIARMVESWAGGDFLNICDVLAEEGLDSDLECRVTVEKAVEMIDSVSDVLKESIEMQESVIDCLQDQLQEFPVEVERTSTDDMVRMRSNLMHNQLVYSTATASTASR